MIIIIIFAIYRSYLYHSTAKKIGLKRFADIGKRDIYQQNTHKNYTPSFSEEQFEPQFVVSKNIRTN